MHHTSSSGGGSSGSSSSRSSISRITRDVIIIKNKCFKCYQLEEFEKVRVLGVGGTGIVYELLHKTNGKRYAMKVNRNIHTCIHTYIFIHIRTFPS